MARSTRGTTGGAILQYGSTCFFSGTVSSGHRVPSHPVQVAHYLLGHIFLLLHRGHATLRLQKKVGKQAAAVQAVN